jgi:peptidoglycan/LPS O-acetylase OafA/YrhL
VTILSAEVILWGSLLAVAGNPALGDRLGVRLGNWFWGTIGFALIGLTVLFRAPWFRESFRYTIQGLALMPLFALAIRQGSGGPLRFLNSYAMRLLGVYSYTIYLCHFVIQYYLDKQENFHSNFLINFIVIFLGSFCIAAVMYNTIDRPMTRVRRRFGH